MLLSCRDGFVLSALSRSRIRVVKVEVEDCGSVAGEVEACSVQECKNVL